MMDEMGMYNKVLDEALLRGQRLQLDGNRPGTLFSLNVPVIFIMIGGNRPEEDWFRARLRIFLQNPDACVVFSASDCDRDHIIDVMEKEFNQIAQNPAGLLTVTQPIVCPVVFGHRRQSARFQDIVKGVYDYIDSQRWTQRWQPFLLLHMDDSRNYVNCQRAIKVISDAMDGFLSREICCRCCLLCNRDSEGFAVEDENLLNTVILLTLLQSSSTAKNRDRSITETIGAQIGRDGEKKFYSARAVSIESPVLPILLDRIRAILGLLLEGEVSLSESSDLHHEEERVLNQMDMAFLSKILQPYLSRLPHDNNHDITPMPLYSIMPGEKNQIDRSELIDRAKKFYREYYRDHLLGDKARSEQQKLLLEYFLPEYIKAGGSLQGLRHILFKPEKDIKSWLAAVHMVESIHVAPVGHGEFPQKMKPDSIFDEFEQQVSSLVNGSSGALLLSIAEPELRSRLRQKLEDIIGALTALSARLYAVSLSQQRTQVSLPLMEAPPDESDVFFRGQKKWLRRKLEDKQNEDLQEKWQALYAHLLRVRQDDPDTLVDLVRRCCDIAEEGLTDSELYMRELNQICGRNPDQMNDYICRIKQVWLFPVRLAPDTSPAIENRDPVGIGIIGNLNNVLCRKLEEVFEGSKLSSIADVDRRIDLLRLSGAFQHDELALWKTLEKQENVQENDKPELDAIQEADALLEEGTIGAEGEQESQQNDSGMFAALPGLTARYDPIARGILFRWEHSVGLSYPWLYIYQLHRKPDGTIELGKQLRRTNLANIQNQCVVESQDMRMRVDIMEYLVFAASKQTEVKSLSEFESEMGYFCRAALGYSSIRYSVKYGVPSNGLKWASVRVEFTSDIPGDMVCYTCNYGSAKEYVYSFPMERKRNVIRRGCYDYAPVLLPDKAQLYVTVTAPGFRNNIEITDSITKKTTFFLW